MSEKLTDKGYVTTLTDDYGVVLNAGGAVKQMKISNFREQLNDNDQQVLNNLAFYIDVNRASSKGSTKVDVGGNAHMQAVWANMRKAVLMDASGNYCELNQNDCRYTAEGEAIVDTDTGALLSKWANCDVMIIIPKYYGKIQSVTINGSTILRPWFSPVQLPGGYEIPQQVVGKFKASLVSSKLRSVPNATPANNRSIYSFWSVAQARSTNHGLANADFHDWLLFYMMSSYGYRDSQNCQTSDGTLVWGVGLDGSENTTSSSASGFDRQKSIVTGATLSLGTEDGKVAETDSAGGTCHSVNVAGFENPWGQYWEMVGGLCAVGTDVYRWRSNFIPSESTPTASTFTNVDHVVLTRATSNGVTGMNIVESEDGQGVYMIPGSSLSGVSYGDNYYYAASGQLWLWGGSAYAGADCGLACAYSDNAWTYAHSHLSARLAYYGEITKVSAAKLAELVA